MSGIIKPGQVLPPQGPMMITAALGMSGAMIGCSAMCVNCFPKAMPAFFIWGGDSLCAECFVPLRKAVDKGEVVPPAHIVKRDPAEVWREEPQK